MQRNIICFQYSEDRKQNIVPRSIPFMMLIEIRKVQVGIHRQQHEIKYPALVFKLFPIRKQNNTVKSRMNRKNVTLKRREALSQMVKLKARDKWPRQMQVKYAMLPYMRDWTKLLQKNEYLRRIMPYFVFFRMWNPRNRTMHRQMVWGKVYTKYGKITQRRICEDLFTDPLEQDL